jgi:thiol-disulfide isomerase/thioredoxin
MKKLLLFAICTIFYSSYAQLPPNSFGEDFTITDINGQEHNLHSILDEGKTVILDLFAVWCGPCWDFAVTGVLEDLQNAYPDEVVCMAIEADASTAANLINGGGNSVGDWTTVIDYIMADDPNGNIGNDYALSYYPTIYKICPDRMVTEVGQLSSVNAFYSEVGSCSSATYSKDAKILSYNGDNTYCNGTLPSSSVTIQNYSINNATMSACNILTKANGNVINSTEWSGSLDTYQTASVDLGSISNIPNNANISFEIEYSGDMDNSNNTLNPSISGASESSTYVRLNILLDSYPDETSWQLFDSNGNVVESTNIVGQAYQSPGDYTGNANGNVSVDWVLSDGCYTFEMYDAFGDGLAASQWGGTDGSAELVDYANNITLWTANSGDWDIAAGSFNAGALANLEDVKAGQISIYPNPSHDNVNLYINSNKNSSLNLEIYNNLGKVVFSEVSTLSNGSNNKFIDLNELNPGLYYVNAIIDGENNIKPLNIIK